MGKWGFPWRGLLARDGATREGRTGGRPTGKSAGAVEPEKRDGSWIWVLTSGVVLLVMHLALFPPVPRLSADFPGLGEISEREIRAPFSFAAPLLDRDVQMIRLEKVVVEPPVLRSVEPVPGQAAGSRMELWLSVLAETLADSSTSTEDRVGMLSLQLPSLRANDIRRMLSKSDQETSPQY